MNPKNPQSGKGFGRHVGAGSPLPLKDSVDSALVDRVWFRLEEQLEPQRRKSSASPWVWGLAASAAAFGAGVWVGQGDQGGVVPITDAIVAEAPLPAANASATVREVPADRAEPGPVQPRKPDVAQPRAVRRGVERRGVVSLRGVPAPVVSAPAVEASSAPVPSVLPSSLPEATPSEALTQETPPAWQKWAHDGEYDAALFELSQAGGFESVLQTANPEQLMLLADVARATGQPHRAIAALKKIVGQFPENPLAPLATYSLGNLLDKVGDRAAAAEAFSAYQQLSPEGDFAEDALVRRIRSAVERGEGAQARRLATQYESTFPGGQRGEEVAELLQTLPAQVVDNADAGVPPEPMEESKAPEQESETP